MSNDLDRRAALAMGWAINSDHRVWSKPNRESVLFENWSPSTDRNDLAELLQEVEKRGHSYKLDVRMYCLWEQYTDRNKHLSGWLLTADPAIICAAAVEVLEDENE